MSDPLTFSLDPYLALTLPAVIAYLLGAIPTGVIVARSYGVDIRQHGSGNIGFTNVFRTLGFTPGSMVLAADILKGWAAVKISLLFLPAGNTSLLIESVPVAAGLASILGHTYSVFLGMKGGKGVATAAGVLLALTPQVALGLVVIWAAVLALSRYVSLASVVAALSFPALILVVDFSLPKLAFALAVSALVIVKHRDNVGRLLRREESRFEFRRSHARMENSVHREDA